VNQEVLLLIHNLKRGMKMKKYIILITILLLLLIGSSGALAGSYSELEPLQKQFYWSCIKEDCIDFIKNKQYGEWRSCVFNCIAEAEEVKPVPVEELFCEDTDNGIDYKNFGTVTSNKYPNGKDDFCYVANGKNYVFESACKNNKYIRYQKNCKNYGPSWGCVEGACVELNVPPVFEPLEKEYWVSIGEEFVLEIIATDDNGDELEYSVDQLPEGAEFNGNIFTWTPTKDQPDINHKFHVSFDVTDGEFTVSKHINIYVYHSFGCNSIVKKKEYFEVNGKFFQYKSAGDISETNPKAKIKDMEFGEQLEYSIGHNDEQAHFNIKFNNKEYQFVSASDPTKDDWDIMYQCPNYPPVLEPLEKEYWISIGEEFVLELIANDKNGDQLEYFSDELPEGSELNGNIFTWTPTEDQSDDKHYVHFKVTDGEFTVSNYIKFYVYHDLVCDEIIKEDDYFDLDGHFFQYKGADDMSKTVHMVKFKDIETGEYLEKWASGNEEQAFFNFKLYGKNYEFESASSPNQNDWDIMYKCNHAPVLAPIGNKKIKIDQELVIELSATDEDGDSLQYIVATMPVGAELNGNIFTWTPTKDQIGEYHVMFIVSDGELEDSEVVKISEDLECDDIVKDNEYFILDNILLQYKGADKNSVSSPKIKFKNLNTGETLEYSVSFVNQQGSVTLKLGGKVYGFVSASNTNQKDWDIMYKCGG
jgi:hypothetical protein